MAEIDVTKNIQLTEELKCSLLTSVSELFNSMSKAVPAKDRAEILSDILAETYLLGQMLGVAYSSLDRKASARARARALSESTNEEFAQKLMFLYKHLNQER